MTEIKYCETCGQKVMIYRRKIRKALVRGMRVALKKGETITWREAGVTDMTVLKFWGFIYFENGKQGRFGLTKKGEDFLKGKIRVPKTAFVYNDRLQPPPEGYKEEWVHISDIDNGEDPEITTESMLAEAIPFIY